MRSFRRFSRQVTVLRLPVALVPLAALAQVIGELAFYAFFLAVIIAAYGIADGELYLNASPELLLAPVALVWTLAIAGSVGLFTAYPFYHARDIRFVYRLVLPFWLFVTPVVYSLESVEGIPGVVARLNPLAAPVELFKLGVLGIGDLPLYSVLVSVAVTALVLTAGLTLASRFGTKLASAPPDDGDVLEDEI
jgi:ABC-type polysaccharide/polyol phosphate export permease